MQETTGSTGGANPSASEGVSGAEGSDAGGAEAPDAALAVTETLEDAAEQMLGPLAEPVNQYWGLLEAQPALRALILLALGFVLAKVANFILSRVIGHLTRKTRTQLDDKLLELIRSPVFYTVFLFGASLALRQLALPEGFVGGSVRLLQTVVVLLWLRFGFPASRLILDSMSRHRERLHLVEERTIPLFDNLAKIVLFAGASYAILLIWNIDPTAWLTSAGILGIALGFAAKDTLANLFSGIFIVADAPYKLGDFVILDSGERGQVTHVGIRSTRLLTRDDVEITIPNNVIANAKIINESGGPWIKERVRVQVGVAYGSDLDQVIEVLEDIAASHEDVCKDPKPRVRFRTFGESSLDLELLCWIDEPVLRGRMLHELNLAVYKAFHREGIEIPFPQRDLHIKQMPPPASPEAAE